MARYGEGDAVAGKRSAMIGHTGFVGGNLCRQFDFTDLYNSSNIDSIAGRAYDLVVCAGARAEKWRINRDPAADRADLTRLTTALSTVCAGYVVHISTVDVYPNPESVDETTTIDRAELHPYGLHRLELEEFVRARFDALLVRLPGLFGTGLRKNIIYDFLHVNNLHKIDSRGRYQFYGLDRLWADITRARELSLQLVNLATEPVAVADVAQAAFGLKFDNIVSASPPSAYDMWSRYAQAMGGSGHYLCDAGTVLDGINSFVQRERAG
jgi:nucleoside-diphosphate-sugar epimerase